MDAKTSVQDALEICQKAAQEPVGAIRSEETKRKIGNARRGKKRSEFSEEWKRNLSRSCKGLKKSEETRQRIRLGLTGLKKTKEHIDAFRTALPLGRSGHRGIAWSEQHKKWRVRLSINGKRKDLGLFKKLEDAVRVTSQY